jgi:hypothetical protein
MATPLPSSPSLPAPHKGQKVREIFNNQLVAFDPNWHQVLRRRDRQGHIVVCDHEISDTKKGLISGALVPKEKLEDKDLEYLYDIIWKIPGNHYVPAKRNKAFEKNYPDFAWVYGPKSDYYFQTKYITEEQLRTGEFVRSEDGTLTAKKRLKANQEEERKLLLAEQRETEFALSAKKKQVHELGIATAIQRRRDSLDIGARKPSDSELRDIIVVVDKGPKGQGGSGPREVSQEEKDERARNAAEEAELKRIEKLRDKEVEATTRQLKWSFMQDQDRQAEGELGFADIEAATARHRQFAERELEVERQRGDLEDQLAAIEAERAADIAGRPVGRAAMAAQVAPPPNTRDLPRFNPDKDEVLSFVAKFTTWCQIQRLDDATAEKWSAFQMALEGRALLFFDEQLKEMNHRTAAGWVAIFNRLKIEFNAYGQTPGALERAWMQLDPSKFKDFPTFVEKVKEVAKFQGKNDDAVLEFLKMKAPANIWVQIRDMQLPAIITWMRELKARTGGTESSSALALMSMQDDKDLRIQKLEDLFTQLTFRVMDDKKPDNREEKRDNNVRFRPRSQSGDRNNFNRRDNSSDRGRGRFDRSRDRNSDRRESRSRERGWNSRDGNQGGDRRDYGRGGRSRDRSFSRNGGSRSRSGPRRYAWFAPSCEICEGRGHYFEDCDLYKKMQHVTQRNGGRPWRPRNGNGRGGNNARGNGNQNNSRGGGNSSGFQPRDNNGFQPRDLGQRQQRYFQACLDAYHALEDEEDDNSENN